MRVEIIVLALIALFVGLRLFSVLGRRTGHEQPIARPVDGVAAPPPPAAPVGLSRADPVNPLDEALDPGAIDGIRAIVAADPRFDLGRFIDGAKAAYTMTLEAFWEGDEEELSRLADDEVKDAFSHAIAERKASGHRFENRLVGIDRAVVEAARLEGQMAHVTVRFDADISAVTRDKDDNVVAGSTSDAVQTHDVWTFSRHVRADDPNWILVETDEAA
jgi:predicted lipid-binding transport protein (Tim44 family)